MIALVISPAIDGDYSQHRLANIPIDYPLNSPESYTFATLIPYLDPNRWFASYTTALKRAQVLSKEHDTFIHTYRFNESFYAARKRLATER